MKYSQKAEGIAEVNGVELLASSLISDPLLHGSSD